MMERRTVRTPGEVRVEKREGQAGPGVVTGYAAVFYNASDPGTEYGLYPGASERIMPGAFTRALAEDDVRALFNHDPNHILGRSKAGTLALSQDAKGLKYEITLPDTQAGRDLAESIRRGDITGSSFGFVPRATTYRKLEDGAVAVERTDVALYDVSPVTFPAYPSTEAGLRSEGEVEAARREVEGFEASRVSILRRYVARAVEVEAEATR